MKLMLIDGNSILNRAFYGIKLLTTKEGVFTNGVYGFLNILFKFMDEENPDEICICFDMRAKTFRHKAFEAYKAQRKGMPDELASQMPILKEVIDALGISRCEMEGYEADDIIATLARKCDKEGKQCVVITGDKDSLQLVTDNITVKLPYSRMGKSDVKTFTPMSFKEEYGFEPIKIVDLKAIMGDSSDNIPGVPGIGEKGASDLIKKFGSLTAVYENIDSPEIKEGVRQKLIASKDLAEKSYWLATAFDTVPDVCTDLKIKDSDNDKLSELFEKLEFYNFSKRLVKKQETFEPKNIETETISSVFEAACMFNNDLYILEDNNTIFILHDKKLYETTDFDVICEILKTPNKKSVHDYKAISKKYCEVVNCTFDTSIAGYCIDPSENSYSMDRLCFLYLKENTVSLKECAILMDELCLKMQERLDKDHLVSLFEDIELPLAKVLFDMEKVGFAVSENGLVEFGNLLTEKLNALTSEIYMLADEEFNINSPKQLGNILFEKMGLKNGKKTKTGFSTDADTLEKLKTSHPIINFILKYRSLSKLKSTYVEGLLKVIDKTDGRIHTTFKQTVTQTGRISSTEPNLQNIPIKEEMGKEIRKQFVASDGYVLLDADYSQIELRVLAHVASDTVMIEAFKNNIDIHTLTASEVFDTPIDQVTPEQRRRAKAVNFGIVYGISAFSLAEDIGVSRKEAGVYIDEYFKTYPGIKSYLDNTIADAYNNGYVTTMFNRRRYLAELSSGNKIIKAFGERVAMNTPIQGTAADIIKIAMIKVHNKLLEEGLSAKVILQVHDELIVEAPEAEADRVAVILREQMESAATLKAPLVAEVHVGKNWLDAK